MSLLEVKDLAFSYGTKPVFSHVSFRVEKGQIFCLVGPNGSGKTTVEHCLLTHMKPQSGEILLRGRKIADYSPVQLAAELAYVPQNHTRSFPYQTVDVVTMGRTRQRRFLQPGGDDRDSAIRSMELLGIAHLAQVEYSTLSGGELQLVLLARALTQDSEILVLDEPAAHLDIKRTQDILLLLAKIVREQGKTIILTTHDFNHPLLLQDEGTDVRMALMHDGRMEAAGTPTDILSSGMLERIYGIKSRILEIPADRQRHYLAAWSE